MPMLTFWKRERLELLREKSANRTVTTVFRRPGATELFAVVNCHLSAGDAGGAPRKRFQQLEQGLDTARKELGNAADALSGKPQPKKKKAGGGAPQGAVCVVGDFNSDATVSSNGRLVVWLPGLAVL